MNRDGFFQGDNNIISLAEARRMRDLTMAAEAPLVVQAPPCRERELIVFVTGGRFEVMVNGAVGVAAAGEIVRVPLDAVQAFKDIGAVPGTIVTRGFLKGLDIGFYRELAAALPPCSTEFPKPGTLLFRRLCGIARRWGVKLDDNRAA